MSVEDGYGRMLRWRGVETPCEMCRGSGVRPYASTATWRGGIGGCAITRDLCDTCWGSGDKDHHWTDLRKWQDTMQADIERLALTRLSDAAGCQLSNLRPTVGELVTELRKLANQRRPRPRWWSNVCLSLAETLESAAKEPGIYTSPTKEPDGT